MTMSIHSHLRTAGFTEYEARSYVNLIRHGEMTASELSRASGIPHSKIYEVASKLAEKGLVEVQKSRPMIFRATLVEIALKRFERKTLQDLKEEYSMRKSSLEKFHRGRITQVSDAFKETYKELQALSKVKGEPDASDELIWTVRNRDNVLSNMKELIMEASRIKLIVPPELFEHLEREIRTTKAKGEIIVQHGTTRGLVSSMDLKVYYVEKIPFKCGVLITDNEMTIFTSENLEMGFKSRNPSLATILTHFFEHEMEETRLEQETA